MSVELALLSLERGVLLGVFGVARGRLGQRAVFGKRGDGCCDDLFRSLGLEPNGEGAQSCETSKLPAAKQRFTAKRQQRIFGEVALPQTARVRFAAGDGGGGGGDSLLTRWGGAG